MSDAAAKPLDPETLNAWARGTIDEGETLRHPSEMDPTCAAILLARRLLLIEQILCDKSLCGHFTAEEIRKAIAGELDYLLLVKP